MSALVQRIQQLILNAAWQHDMEIVLTKLHTINLTGIDCQATTVNIVILCCT